MWHTRQERLRERVKTVLTLHRATVRARRLTAQVGVAICCGCTRAFVRSSGALRHGWWQQTLSWPRSTLSMLALVINMSSSH